MAVDGRHHGPLVVLVEDQELQARLLRSALADRMPGCEVEVIGDGAQAARRLAHVDRRVPDLLVLDLALPGLSGHDLLVERAGDPRLARVPAAIVTSSDSPDDRERSLALGATLHLSKPLDLDGFAELADRLAALIA
jgi:two-component system OmpR family response regulator